MRRRPRAFAFLSGPIDTPPSHGSLAGNQLCGLDGYGRGTYTSEGITKLCEALKGSAVTSLKCAAAPRVSCQRPLTLLTTRLHSRVLAVCNTPKLVPKEELLLLRA